MLKVLPGLVLPLLLINVNLTSFAAGPSVGEVAPTWQYLQGTDGKLHSSADYKEAKILVVAFLCNKCPCVKGYDARFQRFVDEYATHGVQLIGINCSLGGIETMDGMKQRAVDGGYTFDYLRDPSQKIGREFGATSTPHVFILDQNRTIAYTGAFDDNRSESQVQHHYVRDAVNALLKEQDVPVKVSKQFGCTIKY
jgi:peroxiredoxin